MRVTVAAFVTGQTISRCAQRSSSELPDCSGCVSWRSTQRSHSVQWKIRSLEGLPGLCWHGDLHSTAENETSLTRAHEAADLLCAGHLQQHRALIASYKAVTSFSFALAKLKQHVRRWGLRQGATLVPGCGQETCAFHGTVLNPGAPEVKQAQLQCSISHALDAAAWYLTNQVDELFLAHEVRGREKLHHR